MEENGVDLNSNLPRNILEIILIHMPIKDAVRTSVLSRKWRYAWASTPVLEFDVASIRVIPQYSAVKRLTRIIDHVLLLHNGPIEKFKLSSYFHGYSFHVDKWILFLSRQGVNNLFLGFEEAKEYPYIVPSCLFSCEQLKELSLSCCELRTPLQFNGFCRLKALDLKDTRFTKETVESLISSCPLLEELSIRFDYRLEHIKLHAPKLKIFYLSGVFDDLSLVGATCLVHACIVLHGQSDLVDAVRRRFKQTNNLDKFFGSLVNLAKLTIGMYFMQHWTTYQSSPNLEEVKIYAYLDRKSAVLYEERFWEEHKIHDCTFNHLKVIVMCGVKEGNHLLGLFKFVLANAPVLETMTIKMAPKVTEAAKKQTLKSLLQFPRASVGAQVSCLD
ncbi:hypothetical protein H6P81_021032 [Aristolochia fimbriata]|uniref:F-box domain-containing protein n=1 Tax=Aristolochia fimbriata TaxID=158543 RepID=A0AAV7DZ36_ARIFI|nr:hypothetical protein H6P81_021032 [Aristolochia fimbriata]